MAKGERGRPPRSEVYERFATQIDELHDRLGGLPSPLEAESIWTGIWYEEATGLGRGTAPGRDPTRRPRELP